MKRAQHNSGNTTEAGKGARVTKHLPIIVAAVMLLVSCGHHGRPDGVISPLKMSEFLTEAYLIEAYNNLSNPVNRDSISSDIRAAYDDLLARQGLTQEQVERSLDYYGHNPDQYEKILNDVMYRLEDYGQNSITGPVATTISRQGDQRK